jgi:chorismate dehydratase
VTPAAPVRLAAVAYRNAWPLLEGLRGLAGVELSTATPADVAARLADGSVDAGLVPSIELLRQPGLRPAGGACIAAYGPVDSVILLLRRAPDRVRTIALDPASRTSQVLAALILERVYGARPESVACDPDAAWAEGRADAVLVIGDRALHWRARGVPFLDLADAWTRLTGLPFVFAVWGAREETCSRHPGLGAMLDASFEAGRRALDALARRAAEDGPLDAAGFGVYLTRRIRYGLGPAERQGLRTFLELARCSI